MKYVGITRLREDLAQFVRSAEMLSDSVVIKRNGHEVAALVSIADYHTLEEITRPQKDAAPTTQF